jgi:hypothetical protein
MLGTSDFAERGSGIGKPALGLLYLANERGCVLGSALGIEAPFGFDQSTLRDADGIARFRQIGFGYHEGEVSERLPTSTALRCVTTSRFVQHRDRIGKTPFGHPDLAHQQYGVVRSAILVEPQLGILQHAPRQTHGIARALKVSVETQGCLPYPDRRPSWKHKVDVTAIAAAAALWITGA